MNIWQLGTHRFLWVRTDLRGCEREVVPACNLPRSTNLFTRSVLPVELRREENIIFFACSALSILANNGCHGIAQIGHDAWYPKYLDQMLDRLWCFQVSLRSQIGQDRKKKMRWFMVVEKVRWEMQKVWLSKLGDGGQFGDRRASSFFDYPDFLIVGQ